MSGNNAVTRAGVIMAGGSGERFWPLSRAQRPKQLLRLTRTDVTMLGEAVERLAPIIPAEHVYVVTGEHLVEPIRRGRIGVPDENVIAEPCKRNTSGALAYAAAFLLARYRCAPESLSMAVTTADHNVGDPVRFTQVARAALDAAERRDALATLGVVPTRPETGYGYIQVAGDPEMEGEDVALYPVSAFHEKPDRDRAEAFVKAGRFFWNSGMFFWKVSVFLSELETARPPLARAVRELADALTRDDRPRARAVFEGLDDISIDYALMERARHVLMARADFPWDDIGAWTALERTLPADTAGNTVVGAPVIIESEGCIVYNEPGADRMAVGVVGCRDLVVVVTEDAVLVVPKDRAQDVREAVKELKRRNARQV